MKVLFPTGQMISPGFHMIDTQRVEIEEVWFMGHLIEEKEVVIEEEHGVHVPEPAVGERGVFVFADKTFTVVRDDDLEFWGGVTKAEWFADLQEENRVKIQRFADAGWWDLAADGSPQKAAKKISKSAMEVENKTLMAHLMVDLGFFPSVSQARKNGWDKPLELGRHELGPKKKREFVEIIA